MGLAKPGERDTIPVGNLPRRNIVVEKELGFQLDDYLIQGNVRAAKLGGNFTCFTGKNREQSVNLAFLWYVGRVELIQDLVGAINKRFIFFSCGTVFSLEEVCEDLNAFG